MVFAYNSRKKFPIFWIALSEWHFLLSYCESEIQLFIKFYFENWQFLRFYFFVESFLRKFREPRMNLTSCQNLFHESLFFQSDGSEKNKMIISFEINIPYVAKGRRILQKFLGEGVKCPKFWHFDLRVSFAVGYSCSAWQNCKTEDKCSSRRALHAEKCNRIRKNHNFYYILLRNKASGKK